MSQSSEPVDHLDVDALADLDEGLVPAERAAAMVAHVERCTACAQLQASLRSTREWLSTLPADPMPAEVVARLDAALAAEATTTVVPLEGRRRRWRRAPTFAGAAAAVTALALISALVYGGVHKGTSTDTSNRPAGAAKAPTGKAVTPTESGRSYTLANIPTLVPLLLTTSQASAAQPGGLPEDKGLTPIAPVPSRGAAGQTLALTPLLAALKRSPEAVRACVATLAGQPTTPLAVDVGRYDGKPAAVIVLPTPGNAAKVDVWVVRTTCDDITAFARIDRA